MTKSDHMVYRILELVVARIWKYLTRKTLECCKQSSMGHFSECSEDQNAYSNVNSNGAQE